ncbi:Conserved uncharacterized cytosolic protein, putative [hydrothermal vent metagenome]|uniref:Conserved uncharacterized cytosolic protein, putative n=1 Tax=hydrothermal vent metagenome TaxID=652676 RepID=A0A1W1CVA8_9ZZZZ
MRDFFKRVEDGSEMIVETDSSAYGYSQRYDWLLSVFIKFDMASESGEGFEEYLELKESLIIALEHDEKAKYVGGRSVDGWSELYFYAAESKGLVAQVDAILKDSGYKYESSVVRDAKWDFHYKNLTPNELEFAHMQSEKIIYLLEEEGDVLEMPRIVEHYVSFDTPTQKERFLDALMQESFQFKDEISSEEFENGIALTKEHAVTEEVLKAVVEELFVMIKSQNGYYEGWSTTLVKED